MWKKYAAAALLSFALACGRQKSDSELRQYAENELWNQTREAVRRGDKSANYISGVPSGEFLDKPGPIDPLYVAIANILVFYDKNSRFKVFEKGSLISENDFINEVKYIAAAAKRGEEAVVGALFCDQKIRDDEYLYFVGVSAAPAKTAVFAHMLATRVPGYAMDSEWVGSGIQVLYSDFGYDVDVPDAKTFDDFRKGIDEGKLSVIIQPQKLTVVGYLDKSSRYLIVHDPLKSKSVPVSLLTESDRKSRSEWAKKMDNYLKAKEDAVGTFSEELPVGTSFYAPTGKEEAVTVGKPRRSLEAFSKLMDRLEREPENDAICTATGRYVQ